MKIKYDIFISYRRKWGALYSRILQLKLQEKGYKVFLDYDELRDGHFDEKIRCAIKNSSLFLFMFSKDALERCKNEDDWVRHEILYAIENKKHIIPVIPDLENSEIPSDIPLSIADAIAKNEYSDVDYGKALDSSVNSLINDRIIPHIGKRNPLEKKILNLLSLIIILVCIFLLSYRLISDYVDYISCNNLRDFSNYQTGHTGLLHFFNENVSDNLNKYYEIMPHDTLGITINVDSSITYNQLVAFNSILDNMIAVEGGTYMMGASDSDFNADDVLEKPQIEIVVSDFLIGKYEVSVSEWNSILGKSYDEKDGNFPMSNITWYECQAFVDTLYSLTGVRFVIPTEAEWEWAAKGGNKSKGFLFSGSQDVNEVAVYKENSKGKPRKRPYGKADHFGLEPNELEIYDMSGNVEEWCSDDFREYKDLKTHTFNPKFHDGDVKVIRGGSYESPATDTRITTRSGKPSKHDNNYNCATPTVGLRLLIRK